MLSWFLKKITGIHKKIEELLSQLIEKALLFVLTMALKIGTEEQKVGKW